MIKLFFYAGLFSLFFQTNNFAQDLVKAKIAIMHKYGDDFAQLRTNDRLRVGEMIRIFVQPENDCYVYVVHTDNNESTLLFDKKVKAKKDTLILPSTSEFYVFDNKSPTAEVTIFCSKKKINDLDTLFKGKKNSNLISWNKVEKKLMDKYKKDLNDKSEKPFPIAGNVSAVNDEFLEQQRVLQAKNVLIRKYEIEIKE